MMNTIMLREHNRVCDILKEDHPEWEDEQLFQTAKNIIAGTWEFIAIDVYITQITVGM